MCCVSIDCIKYKEGFDVHSMYYVHASGTGRTTLGSYLNGLYVYTDDKAIPHVRDLF